MLSSPFMDKGPDAGWVSFLSTVLWRQRQPRGWVVLVMRMTVTAQFSEPSGGWTHGLQALPVCHLIIRNSPHLRVKETMAMSREGCCLGSQS